MRDIAQRLREDNICEYLLYMWQVEDTIRAFGCDIDRIREEYLAGFPFEEVQVKAETVWFDNLVRMMHEEGRVERGHLQINMVTLQILTDLHQELLRSPKQAFYSAAYYKALPFIVELRRKAEKESVGEVETCLECMYGVMMLRLQHREISKETQQAVAAISRLLAMLSDAYKKEKQGELEL